LREWEKSCSLDTSDWKTYRNEKYGFEIKYPEGWNIDDTKVDQQYSKDTIIISQFEISTMRQQDKLSYLTIDYTGDVDPEAIQILLSERGETVDINGIKMHRINYNRGFDSLFEGRDGKSTYYIVAKPGMETSDNDESILEKIVASFRFL
jgi:hypothetical protein